ncbi:MAG: hydrogenase expression/formation protein HypE [Elusimicrobia bacterium]|nr:hydrogenase expression/formation protein HypE [Candidatus Liberimonas magnetica]
MKENKSIITLAHGSGGRLTHELINSLFKKHFSNPYLNKMDDAAAFCLKKNENRLAFTTDSFVVDPLFFPGGDIGKLSICGTVNDLAMKGAVPLYIAIGAIIEEGLEIDILEKVVISIKKAAVEAKVFIVAGDTKVVEKGKADKLFLTTSGIGAIYKDIFVSGSNTCPGDTVIINGSIGEHGIAVLTARNDFKLANSVKSDCSPLNNLVKRMLSATNTIHTLRDPTRGGVATTLNEIAQASNVGIIVEEDLLPIKKQVSIACNILGIDPLYVANEGKLIATCPQILANKIIKSMKNDKYGRGSVIIGKAVRNPKGVWLSTKIGGLRPLIMLEGEQLPRIC